MKDQLLSLGWVDKGDVLVRYSNPRIGWKPADGTLIIGFHEWRNKVATVEQLDSILERVEKTTTEKEMYDLVNCVSAS